MALDDIPGPVELDEIDRNALRARALEGGKPMADLLETHPEEVAQPHEIMPHALRLGGEMRVGHEERGGEIIRQGGLRDRAGIGRAQGCIRRAGVDHRAVFQSGDLVGEMEGAGCGIRRRVEAQHAAFRVKRAQPGVILL